MNYLLPSEYEQFGLETATPEVWTSAASTLINAHCRRTTLFIAQYLERIRLADHRYTLQLSYLPLAPIAPSTNAITAARGRYSPSQRRGDNALIDEFALNVARTFSLPGTWITMDPAAFDYDMSTGEVSLPGNILGLTYDEIEITYNAGLNVITDEVKFACAQLVKNAQATPALNVQRGRLDTLRLDYFADGLLDESVRKMLAPYVAQKAG
jgi:hypothetical protein